MFGVPVSNCLGIKAPYKTNSVQIANAIQNTKLIDFFRIIIILSIKWLIKHLSQNKMTFILLPFFIGINAIYKEI